jgi:signal peptidase II
MKKFWFCIICLFLLALDIFTKSYTVNHIGKISWLMPFFPYGGIPVFHDFFGISFSLNYVANKGSALGFFAAYSSFLFYLRVGIVIAIIIYLATIGKKKPFFLPLMLLVTGAIGNIIDTIIYGHVVDMFHFTFFGYSYPVFNIADSLICIAIAWMLIWSLTHKSNGVHASGNHRHR